MRPNFYTLNSSELVRSFNEMVGEASSLDLQATTTNRFSTRATAIRRSEELYKAICDKKGLEYEQPGEMPAGIKETPKRVRAKVTPKQPKASKKEKPVKKTKEVKQAKDDKATPIAIACRVRGGSMLETILLFLEARLGKQVPETAIMKHIYNDPDKKTNRMLHLAKNMKEAKGYRLDKMKDEKGIVSYALYTVDKKGSE